MRYFSRGRARRSTGPGAALGGIEGGSTPTSSEASTGGVGGGNVTSPEDPTHTATSAYNTPTASMAALTSPTLSTSPEVSFNKIFLF